MPKGVCKNTGRTWFKKGQVPFNKGVPMSSESKAKLSQSQKARNCIAELAPNWKGGVTKRRGYVYVLVRNHPAKERDGYVRRNRLVMEESLGRFLQPKESVHHLNGKTDDDRIENLMLFSSESHHRKFHMNLMKWLENTYPQILNEYVKTWVTTD